MRKLNHEDKVLALLIAIVVIAFLTGVLTINI